jgi:hypothetical protein
MIWDTNEVIEAANALGIRLTNANWDTEICGCWADRVMEAKMHWDRGDMIRCQEMIDDANRYAV